MSWNGDCLAKRLQLPLISPASRNASLEALCAQYERLQNALKHISHGLRELENQGLGVAELEDLEERLEPIHVEVFRVEQLIAATPATTLQELALKAAVLESLCPEIGGDIVNNIVRSLCADVARLNKAK